MEFYNLNDTEDKENYDPVASTFSPVKLVNQRRYKILKNIVMKSTTENRNKNILQEKNGNTKLALDTNKTNEENSFSELINLKDLNFKDESVRKYGL